MSSLADHTRRFDRTRRALSWVGTFLLVLPLAGLGFWMIGVFATGGIR